MGTGREFLTFAEVGKLAQHSFNTYFLLGKGWAGSAEAILFGSPLFPGTMGRRACFARSRFGFSGRLMKHTLCVEAAFTQQERGRGLQFSHRDLVGLCQRALPLWGLLGAFSGNRGKLKLVLLLLTVYHIINVGSWWKFIQLSLGRLLHWLFLWLPAQTMA